VLAFEKESHFDGSVPEKRYTSRLSRFLHKIHHKACATRLDEASSFSGVHYSSYVEINHIGAKTYVRVLPGNHYRDIDTLPNDAVLRL